MALDEQERSIRERANRKGYEDLYKAKDPIPTLDQVKCQATRGVTEAQNKKKLRRDYKLNELAYEYDKLFRACVKRKGQEQFHKVEIQKGPLREYDVIYREQVQQRVIASYFKQVKIRDLRIWKGDVRSLAGTILDDGHLLIEKGKFSRTTRN